MSKTPGAPGAGEKKPEHAHKPESGAGKSHEGGSSNKGKGPGPMPGGCLSWGCKTETARFNFCGEHYEQFKFGLIKKTGEPVPDFEKKFEHYQAFKAKRSAQKVA